MPKVAFVEHDGTARVIDIAVGTTLMDGAVDGGVIGIVAICGGLCQCGTCRVHVDPAWLAAAGARSEEEEDILALVDEPAPNARLACQIPMTDALDGAIVHVPRDQH